LFGIFCLKYVYIYFSVLYGYVKNLKMNTQHIFSMIIILFCCLLSICIKFIFKMLNLCTVNPLCWSKLIKINCSSVLPHNFSVQVTEGKSLTGITRIVSRDEYFLKDNKKLKLNKTYIWIFRWSSKLRNSFPINQTHLFIILDSAYK
jgi:hypothetical protein